MEQELETVALHEKMLRFRELAREYPDGPTARHIQELIAELQSELRAKMAKEKAPEDTPKDKPSRTDQARQVAEEYADDQRKIIEKLRKPRN